MSTLRIIVATLILAATSRVGARDAVWQPLPPLPVGAAGFAAVTLDGALHVAGGTTWEADQKRTLDRHWRWPIDDPSWSEQPRLPRPFAHGASGLFGERLLIAAGSTGSETRADVMLLRRDGTSRPLGALPQPHAYGGSAVADGILYILGGTPNVDDVTQLHAAFSAFDLSTGRSETLPPYPDGPVLHPRLVVLGEQIIVFPGGTYDRRHGRVTNTTAVWAWDRRTRLWSSRAPYPFAVRGLGVCALGPGREVLTVGGVRAGPDGEARMTGEAFLYDAENNQFRPAPALPYAAALIELVRVGEWVYALGGEDRPRHRANDVFRARVADLRAATR